MSDISVGSSYHQLVQNLTGSEGSSMQGIGAQLSELSQDVQNGKISSDEMTVKVMEMNYKIGQYNSLTELASNIGKSINDTMKSICQKV